MISFYKRITFDAKENAEKFIVGIITDAIIENIKYHRLKKNVFSV